jgi:hypothetical protein
MSCANETGKVVVVHLPQLARRPRPSEESGMNPQSMYQSIDHQFILHEHDILCIMGVKTSPSKHVTNENIIFAALFVVANKCPLHVRSSSTGVPSESGEPSGESARTAFIDRSCEQRCASTTTTLNRKPHLIPPAQNTKDHQCH